MKKRLSLWVFLVLVAVGASGIFYATSARAVAEPPPADDIAKAIIAREKASVEAWQRKDKAFWSDFLADEATYFSPHGPYLETEPKVNFLPKFEEMAEQFKTVNFQMYNPRVQVYGDVAVLSYNSAATVNVGGRPFNYTGKVTTVYAKQGNTWRVVHGHESMNPGAQ